MTGKLTRTKDAISKSDIPFRPPLGVAKLKFQKDNAPKQTFESTNKRLEREKTDVSPWQSQSPDLNPMESLWDYLPCYAHENNKQYHPTNK